MNAICSRCTMPVTAPDAEAVALLVAGCRHEPGQSDCGDASCGHDACEVERLGDALGIPQPLLLPDELAQSPAAKSARDVLVVAIARLVAYGATPKAIARYARRIAETSATIVAAQARGAIAASEGGADGPAN